MMFGERLLPFLVLLSIKRSGVLFETCTEGSQPDPQKAAGYDKKLQRAHSVQSLISPDAFEPRVSQLSEEGGPQSSRKVPLALPGRYCGTLSVSHKSFSGMFVSSLPFLPLLLAVCVSLHEYEFLFRLPRGW